MVVSIVHKIVVPVSLVTEAAPTRASRFPISYFLARYRREIAHHGSKVDICREKYNVAGSTDFLNVPPLKPSSQPICKVRVGQNAKF